MHGEIKVKAKKKTTATILYRLPGAFGWKILVSCHWMEWTIFMDKNFVYLAKDSTKSEKFKLIKIINSLVFETIIISTDIFKIIIILFYAIFKF